LGEIIEEDLLVAKPYEIPFQQAVAGGIQTGRSLLSLACLELSAGFETVKTYLLGETHLSL
jgi:hypothetical protein